MIEIVRYEPAIKGKVVGYVDVKIVKWGLTIRRIAHCKNATKEWFYLPSYSIPRENGKYDFIPYLQFSHEDAAKRLTDKLLPLLNEYLSSNAAQAPSVNDDEEFYKELF